MNTPTTSPPHHELQLRWPTPLYRAEISDSAVNESLMQLILDNHASKDAETIGMFRGRKSDFGLLQTSSPAVSALQEAIFTAAGALNTWVLGDDAARLAGSMIAEAWSVAYAPQGYHGMHVHAGSTWSGVYYVSAGTLTPGTGQLQLIDPRPAAGAQGASPDRLAYRVDPYDGLLVAFPSWLYHWVTPVEAQSPRICVAFNVGFAGKDEKLLNGNGSR